MLIYYAHSLHLYNTEREERDIMLLESLGFSVVNPNSAFHEDGYKKAGMAYFEEVVSNCHALAFRAYPEGSIPAGVHKEVLKAIELGLPIIELPNGLVRRGLSVKSTYEWLHELGQR